MESLTGAAADSVTSVHDNEDVSDAVVMAVASATGADPLELEPLYDVVDPDALNRLVESAGPAGESMKLTFTMAGCAVVVTGDGEVSVSPPETDDDATVIGRREE